MNKKNINIKKIAAKIFQIKNQINDPALMIIQINSLLNPINDPETLKKIEKTYKNICLGKNKVINVNTSFALSDKKKQKLEKKIKNNINFNQNIIFNYNIEKNIQTGIKVYIDDNEIIFN